MSMSHIAHDCKIGNDIVISNGSQLAGHVEIHDNVIIGGMSGILQFSIIGGHSMIGGMSSVRGHIPPFSVFKGDKIAGVNIIGLRRKGFSNEEIFAIIDIFKNLADKESTLETKLKLIEKSNDKHISKIYRFLNELPANKNLKLADFW
jgi:UDP-N-acetylglucosamine acyltransferase